MARNLVYWDPERGLTRYGRTKHLVRGGLWTDGAENVALCGITLRRRVNSWEALNEFPTCKACESQERQAQPLPSEEDAAMRVPGTWNLEPGQIPPPQQLAEADRTTEQ